MKVQRSRVRTAASVAGMLALAGVGPAAGQQAGGTTIRAAAVEVTFNGRVQTQLHTTSVDAEPFSELELRRTRLDFSVEVNEVVSGRFQPTFRPGGAGVDDAFVNFGFSPGLNLLAGRAHRPFGLHELAGPFLTLPIERGLRIRGVDGYEAYAFMSAFGYSDRDTGIQLRGEPEDAPLDLTYAIGYFAGPLQGASGSQTTYQVAARATVAPVEGLQLGLGWSRRDFTRPVAGGVELRAGSAFEIDVEIGRSHPEPGPHLLAELVTAAADHLTDDRFTGALASATYRLAGTGPISVVEPVVRVSYGSFDESRTYRAPGGTLLTPGLNVYLGGENRMMLNYDHWRPAEGESAGSVKVQMQMSF